MNFNETETYLFALGNEVETMKFGLENITTILEALDGPQNKYKKVQVAGTNGKGSVCAFLESVCRWAKIKTGLYTSPHLFSITERIKIDGVDIAEEEFARIATCVRETAESLLAEGRLTYRPTFFEQVTAIALVAFAEENVEVGILETGLGGRYDAVTAAHADIAAFTLIDLDHQEYLGNTIEDIAEEKAAIIRPDSIVCIGRQPSAAFRVLTGKCEYVGVEPKLLENEKFGPENGGAGFDVAGFQAGEVILSLKGEHQIENAALAILTFKQLPGANKVAAEKIVSGLENAVHPGRIEYIKHGLSRILLDGAHNPAGARALVSYLQQYEPDSQITLLFGGMKEKDLTSMLDILAPLLSDLILTQPSNSRSVNVDDLFDRIESIRNGRSVFRVPSVEHALDSAIQISETYSARSQPLIVITGSLYLVGEARNILISDASV